MYYGIDLGTTNSLIGSGEKLYSGLVSSSVDVAEKKQVSRDTVGDSIVSSYKVNMTTGNEGQLSVECSSVILRDLADRASKESGEEVKDVVISVPAKFTHTQRQAVCNAATKANLNPVGLINEPTAAAIWVCRNVKDLVAVYDLGGGTFDVSIVDTRAGSYFVVASEGLILAGDDFDKAIVDDIYDTCKVKLRYRGKVLKKKLLAEARKAKEAMQKNGCDYKIPLDEYGLPGQDYVFTLDTYKVLMKSTFAKTIALTNHLVECYWGTSDAPKIVFVGGSTACPYLKEWVCQSTGLKEVKCDDQPDYIVAKGVALYAEMLFNGTAEREVDDITKRLCIEDELGMSITIVEKNSIIPTSATISVSNNQRSKTLELNLYQGDALVCRENDYIGTLVYEYDEVKEAGQGFVEVEVTINRDGIISLKGTDILTCMEQSVELTVR